MSKPIDYQSRFLFFLGMMFIMLAFLCIAIGQNNVFWSIWDLAFAAWDAVWAKLAYDHWKAFQR